MLEKLLATIKNPWIMLIILVVALAIGFISIKFLGSDNVVEEAAEEVIKAETGVDLDLSPDTPETQQKADTTAQP